MSRAFVLLALLAGCAEPRAGEDATGPHVTWQTDIAPVMTARCTSCHGGAAPAAGYDLTTYLGAITRATAGDPDSPILDLHDGFADLLPLLRRWVVDDRLAYFDSPLHPPGILDPANAEFHGAELRARAWDFALCSGCHSDDPEAMDFAGGAADRSCRGCHDDGPTACDTCHDESTGAHPAHLVAGDLDREVPCAECHDVPARWDAPGHILLASGAIDPSPAEVTLGALANRDVTPPRRTDDAHFDPATRTCTGVYCHGGVLADPAALHAAPVWRSTGDQAACGGCHGIPPANHASGAAACTTCHPTAADAHLDGVIDLGDRSGTCSACHGDAVSPAPTTGAHRGHLAPSALRGPVACDECHVVPAAVGDAAHLDGDQLAEVTLLRGGTWDRTAGTCSGAYCHGAATPTWTAVGQGEAACGTCHGIPPADAFHAPDLTLSDCATCHPSVDGFGNIVFSGGVSEHLDGDVDFN